MFRHLVYLSKNVNSHLVYCAPMLSILQNLFLTGNSKFTSRRRTSYIGHLLTAPERSKKLGSIPFVSIFTGCFHRSRCFDDDYCSVHRGCRQFGGRGQSAILRTICSHTVYEKYAIYHLSNPNGMQGRRETLPQNKGMNNKQFFIFIH